MGIRYILKNHEPKFGDISINKLTVDYISSILKPNNIILELGSGTGSTLALGDKYKLFSVENQPGWFDRYPEHSTYIKCRSKRYDELYIKPSEFPNDVAWYHPDDIFPNLPEKYDLILIDGPGGWSHGWGRGGFYKHIDKFNTHVPMIFDDVNREEELTLLKLVSAYVKRDYFILEDDITGVIL